jgi:hypothetical protein
MSTPPAFVRALVGVALCLALAASALFPIPGDLPAVALGQTGLYRLEVALAAFYGVLLLVTPAYSGLATGRLPIEISTRGAKFAVEADRSVGANRAGFDVLRGTVNELSEAVAALGLRMERLQRTASKTVDNER